MRRRWNINFAMAGIALFGLLSLTPAPYMYAAANTMGPLTVNPRNPRYFADGSGRAVYLTGSHTWFNFQDVTDGPKVDFPFDYKAYLDFLKVHNHNFMRMWVWEQAAWIGSVPGNMHFGPLPYERTGPGMALDGKPKFDLDRFDQAYFDRLRTRVVEAREMGIYVSVMLFNGFSVRIKGERDPGHNPWNGHPFNVNNNINNVNGDPHHKGEGGGTQTLNFPEITVRQEKYVKKAIDTLHDLDNVLWEICNEGESNTTAWQYHMVKFIQRYEEEKGRQHPVLLTGQWPGGTNRVLFESRADAVSPLDEERYKNNPPAADGRKVILVDTDHLWGVGGDHKWVWKSFLSGLNPIFMDPYNYRLHEGLTDDAIRLIRKNMGDTLAFAKRMNLAAMVPHPNLASSRFCLAGRGREYLAYAPDGKVTVDLSGATGRLVVEWFNPLTGALVAAGTVQGGTRQPFRAPFEGDAILHLHVADPATSSRS